MKVPALLTNFLRFLFLIFWGITSDSAVFGEQQVESRHDAARPWSSFPTKTLEDLSGFKTATIPLTQFGGRKDLLQAPTGYFRVAQINGRWWLIDPEGGPFISAGMVGVRAQTAFSSQEAYTRLFGGNLMKWGDDTLSMLRDYGFNNSGAWSDVETIRHSKKPLPYTVILSMAEGFARKKHLSGGTAEKRFLDNCIPVFHPDFPKYCDEVCAKLDALKSDAFLLGYFSDNELPGEFKTLDKMLAMDEKQPDLAPLRKAAWDWLRQRQGHTPNPAAITHEDRAAFVGYVFETYFKITTAAIRKHDPNHFCLGSRFHYPVREWAFVWEAAGHYVDVIAMNYYNTWAPSESDLNNWYKWSKKPCLITEFYTKGEVTGMGNTGGAGWLVHTQNDRGLFYENFTMELLRSKTCVGWHWFLYMDNDPANTKVGGSNKDSNKGILNTAYVPYSPLISHMKKINLNLYSIVDYFDTHH